MSSVSTSVNVGPLGTIVKSGPEVYLNLLEQAVRIGPHIKLSIDSAIFDSLRGFITLEFPQEPVGITRGTPVVLNRDSVEKWLFEHSVCPVSGTNLTIDDEISVDYLHGVHTILVLSSEKEGEKDGKDEKETETKQQYILRIPLMNTALGTALLDRVTPYNSQLRMVKRWVDRYDTPGYPVPEVEMYEEDDDVIRFNLVFEELIKHIVELTEPTVIKAQSLLGMEKRMFSHDTVLERCLIGTAAVSEPEDSRMTVVETGAGPYPSPPFDMASYLQKYYHPTLQPFIDLLHGLFAVNGGAHPTCHQYRLALKEIEKLFTSNTELVLSPDPVSPDNLVKVLPDIYFLIAKGRFTYIGGLIRLNGVRDLPTITLMTNPSDDQIMVPLLPSPFSFRRISEPVELESYQVVWGTTFAGTVLNGHLKSTKFVKCMFYRVRFSRNLICGHTQFIKCAFQDCVFDASALCHHKVQSNKELEKIRIRQQKIVEYGLTMESESEESEQPEHPEDDLFVKCTNHPVLSWKS